VTCRCRPRPSGSRRTPTGWLAPSAWRSASTACQPPSRGPADLTSRPLPISPLAVLPTSPGPVNPAAPGPSGSPQTLPTHSRPCQLAPGPANSLQALPTRPKSCDSPQTLPTHSRSCQLAPNPATHPKPCCLALAAKPGLAHQSHPGRQPHPANPSRRLTNPSLDPDPAQPGRPSPKPSTPLPATPPPETLNPAEPSIRAESSIRQERHRQSRISSQ